MYHNVGVDWKAFAFKFSGKEELAFQQLAYLLFCAEHNLPWGVFSYYNQTGIETEPIVFENHVIGFQAKYYAPTTSLSTKVTELKKMIDDSKKKNPTITKIIIYTNKELSESTKKNKKKPQYQEAIEAHGNSNGVAIEWRVKSNFEASLFSGALPEHVRDYFFNPANGIREFFQQVQTHTHSIVENIENVIKYNNNCISITQPTSKIDDFIESSSKCLIIHGESGTGKSGIIRDYTLTQKRKPDIEKYPIFVFRATDFGYVSIPEFMRRFGDSSFDEFFSAFENYEKKVVVIDAAEKAITNDVLSSFINQAMGKGWKFVVTIRSSFKDNFINYILKTDAWETLLIENVSWDYLDRQLSGIGVAPPRDTKLQKIICNLFYLNLYLKTYNENSANGTKAQFYSKIWDMRIKGAPHCVGTQSLAREQFVCRMFQAIVERNSYYYTFDYSNKSINEIADMLIADSVISYDDTFGGYHFTHDVFEEIVAHFIIRHEYEKSPTLVDFFSSLSICLPMRRHYRHWLLESLDDELVKQIPAIFTHPGIDKIWQDETLVALMTNLEGETSLVIAKNILAQDSFALLQRAIFLLNTACRILHRKYFPQGTPAKMIKNRLVYRFTQPTGAGWDFIIGYIADNLEKISWTDKFVRPVIEMLTTWVKANSHGNTTKLAGKIALFLYNKRSHEKYSFGDKDLTEKLFNLLASTSHEINEELSEIIRETTESTHINRRTQHIDLCEYLLANVLNVSVISDAMPKQLISLCSKLWRKCDPHKGSEPYIYSRTDSVEDAFGLPSWVHMEYYPTSAFQTPILSLLRCSPGATTKFIVEFLNYSTNCFLKSDMNHEYCEMDYINIHVEDDYVIKQLCSGRLWGMYRGMAAGPNLLECILMAFEKWLLEYIEQADEASANNICKYLLKESNNVAITSLVTGLVNAFPEKLFGTALWLIHVDGIYELEIQRYTHESSTNWLRGGIPKDRIYDDERLESNKLEFRKRTFEHILFDYQVRPFGDKEEWRSKISLLYEQLDRLISRVPAEDTTTRFALNRIDFRKYHPDLESEKISEDGKTYIELVAEEEADLAELRLQQSEDRNWSCPPALYQTQS